MIPIVYNLRSLAGRRWTTIATGLGIAVVAFLFVAVQMFGNGLRRAVGSSAREDVAVIVQKGATDEQSSLIPEQQVKLALSEKGIVKRADGQPDASADIASRETLRTR